MTRSTARLAEKDVHRWVFAHSMDPEQAMTHIVLQYPPTPTPTARAEGDEIIPVGLQGLNSRDAVKALIKATGLNPHMSVCGWPFCLDELDNAHTEEDAA